MAAAAEAFTVCCHGCLWSCFILLFKLFHVRNLMLLVAPAAVPFAVFIHCWWFVLSCLSFVSFQVNSSEAVQ